MADELLPPDWFLRPQNWPYWMPNTLLGTLPPLARLRYPKNEYEIHGLQQFSGANGQAPGLSNDGRSGPASAWLDPVSSPANGGILGSLTRTGDLDQSLSGWAQSPAPLAASAGILAPLARGTGPWGQGAPVWWPSGSHWVGEPGPAKQYSWPAPPVSALGTAQRANEASDRQTSAANPTLRERGLPKLELHHTLPRQFAPQFNEAGIDIESHRTYLPRDQHRLLPKGLHTGTDNWNRQWKRFFEKQKDSKRKEILKLLNDMLKGLFR
jgi:hypothetical protein